MTTNEDDEEGVPSPRSPGEPSLIIGGYVDVERLRQIVAGENRRRAECHAGLRPWLVPPGANPHVPLGIAGSTPEEAEQLANFQASMKRLEAEGWPHYPGVTFPRNRAGGNQDP